jgi:hypothetical protein
MRMRGVALPLMIGLMAITSPCFADSVAVSSGPDGTVVVNGKPCRVVTRDDKDGKHQATNSTSMTAGPNGLSGTTTVSPGSGASSSVTVGSGSSSDGTHTSSAAGSDCVIYKDKDH